jgi:transcriptional regulator with XRE-family HTH domain
MPRRPLAPDRPAYSVLLRKLRRRRRLSQRELATQAALSPTAIGNLERGKDDRTGKAIQPRPETLRHVARGLATDPEDGQFDEAAADEMYAQLMAAAYDQPRPEPPPAPRTPPIDPRLLELFARHPTLQYAVANLAHDLDDAAIDFIARLVETAAETHRRRATSNQ